MPSPDPLTKLCSNCGFRLEASLLRCPLDGLVLGPSRPEVAVLGAYRLVRRLGRGGMGVVYQAENERLGRQVAIKLLHRGLHSDKVVVDRFFLEARAVNTIRHPHVVETYDLVSGPEDLYMVMEYLEGNDLAALLSKSASHPWPLPRVLHVLEQICAALEATHRRGIIHRDLKPANVFLTHRRGAEDFVKVLDFGIVKLAAEDGRLTLEGLTMGTPEYMSPEQVCGDAVIDGRSDIYGLGCIAFEMLTGYQLFGGGSHGDVMLAQLHKAPTSLRRWNPQVPPELDAVILRCLAKDANDRPASAYLLAQELASASGRPFDASRAFQSLTPMGMMAVPSVISPETTERLHGVVRRSPSTDEPAGGAGRRRWAQLARGHRWAGVALGAGVLAALAALIWSSLLTAPENMNAASGEEEAPDMVQVQFQTYPAGARAISLPSKEVWGVTPLERRLLRHSQHRVRFELAGYQPIERVFEVQGVAAIAATFVPTATPTLESPSQGERVVRSDGAPTPYTPRAPSKSRAAPGVSREHVGAGTIDPFAP